MDAEHHDVTMNGAPASFSFYSFLFWKVPRSGALRPPAGEARGPSVVGRKGVGEEWSGVEGVKRKISLSSQPRSLKLVRVNECERVDGVGARLRGLISRVAPRGAAAPSFRENWSSATLKCQLRSREWRRCEGGSRANKPSNDSICDTLPPPPTTRKMSTRRVEPPAQIDFSPL